MTRTAYSPPTPTIGSTATATKTRRRLTPSRRRTTAAGTRFSTMRMYPGSPCPGVRTTAPPRHGVAFGGHTLGLHGVVNRPTARVRTPIMPGHGDACLKPPFSAPTPSRLRAEEPRPAQLVLDGSGLAREPAGERWSRGAPVHWRGGDRGAGVA